MSGDGLLPANLIRSTAMSTVLPAAPRYLSLNQASTITQFSTRTLRRAIQAETLRAHRLGRRVRIDLDELQRWITADGRAASTSSAAPPLAQALR